MNPHIRNLIATDTKLGKFPQSPATIVMRSVFKRSTGSQAYDLYLLKQIVKRAKFHLVDKRVKTWESVFPLPNLPTPSFEQLTINVYLDQLLLDAKLCHNFDQGGPISGCASNFNMCYGVTGVSVFTVSFNSPLEWIGFLEDVVQFSSSAITPSNSLRFDGVVISYPTPLAQLFDFICQELSKVHVEYRASWVTGMLLGLPFEEDFNNRSYVKSFFNDLVFKFNAKASPPQCQKVDSESSPQRNEKPTHPVIQNLFNSFVGENAEGYHTFYPNIPVRFGDTEVQSFTVVGAWSMEDFLSRLACAVSS